MNPVCPPPCRLVVVDEHPVVREGLRSMIARDGAFSICGEADDLRTGLSTVRELQPDIVVVEVSLKSSNGLELVRRLHSQNPDLPILVASIHDEELYAERALAAGARGFINKQFSGSQLLEALRQIRQGNIYLSDRLKDRLVERLTAAGGNRQTSPLHRLSERELEVFRLIGLGKTTREIAHTLCLSPKTVETHRQHIREKLDLADSVKLVREAAHFVFEHAEAV